MQESHKALVDSHDDVNGQADSLQAPIYRVPV
jgi:hypothetical protein